VGPGAQRGVGVRAAFIALVFAIAAFAATPFIPVPVDDRDEQLPVAFRGLYLETRSILSGEEVESHNISLLDASGPGVLLYLAIPLLVIVGVFVTFRRTGRSLPLTIGMLALAVLVLLAGSIYFLPSMIALAIGSFQVRRVEMAGRVAERAAKTADDTPADEDYDDDLEDEDYDDDLEDELDDENEDDDEYEDDDEEVDADAEDDESDDIDDESDEYEDEDDESDDAGESDLDEESKPRQ
jgi:hypothetical protein